MTGVVTPPEAPTEGAAESRWRWPLLGLVTGMSGVLVSAGLAELLDVDHPPVVAVADAIIRLTPGDVAHFFIELVGRADKFLLVTGTLVVSAAIFMLLGALARTRRPLAQAGFVAMGLVAAAATIAEHRFSGVDLVPVVAGLVVWLGALAWLSPAAEVPERRRFLITAGAVTGLSAVAYGAGRWLSRGRAAVEAARDSLTLPVTQPSVPAGVDFGIGEPWMTPTEDFYRIDTSLVVPAVDPKQWTLKIHGLVDNPIEISYDDLVGRELTESWVTLNCVSNPVGGDLIGNAWWSGVRIADLLAEAGIRDGADAVLQTSYDGWTCVTPIEAMTDDRGAMLAIAMNGGPLPIDHGFPVRSIVPGLYGYVSATKWVVDFEVTRFADAQGYWTDKGWSAKGPTKLASRIDLPTDGDTVEAGEVTLAGVAWHQEVGIDSVEVSVDGGPWQSTTLAATPNVDTWVQWRTSLDLGAGGHTVKVRATDKAGQTQSGVQVDPAPNGSEGWHTIDFAVM